MSYIQNLIQDRRQLQQEVWGLLQDFQTKYEHIQIDDIDMLTSQTVGHVRRTVIGITVTISIP